MNNIQYGKILKVENNNGVQSTLIILGTDNHIYLLTATPNGKFCITDEGIINDNYSENGEIMK